MDYIPLYRKWRSQNFDEIVGQEAIVQTLKNAVKSGRVSHAYLFSGPRGTGKTSTARIFAKALNCEKGPTPNPCGKCDQCVKIRNGQAVDVIEIDAASNRGIDEIRDLREKVRYTPVEGKFKVYIIDEVHMLTSEAFNALLKTLEEPPKHAIFVLATTEIQKVPVTILSRCQRLDFRRLSNQEITDQLNKIAKEEGIKAEDAAVNLIARNSDGSLRDAISLLDQMISFGGKEVKHDDVVSVLGTASADVVFEFGDAMGRQDVARLFELINRMVSEGRSISQVTKDIIMHLRNLLLVMMGGDSVIEESSEHVKKLKEQSSLFDQAKLKEIIRLLSKAEVDMKWHPQARLLLEVAVLEACSNQPPVQRQASEPAKKDITIEKPVKSIRLSSLAEELKKPSLAPSDGGISEITARWADILGAVKKKNIFAFISLHEGQPSSLKDGKLVLRFKKGFAFHKGRLEESEARRSVEDALKEVTGKQLAIESVIESDEAMPDISASKVAELFSGKVVS